MKNALLQLGLCLLLRPASGARHRDVGSAVENMLAIHSALPQSRPTLGVVVVHLRWINGSRGDVILESAKVGKELSNASSAVLVDCLSIIRLVNCHSASHLSSDGFPGTGCRELFRGCKAGGGYYVSTGLLGCDRKRGRVNVCCDKSTYVHPLRRSVII